MSQGKLKVINQGIQSENIQNPFCHDKTMTGEKRAAANVPKNESKKLAKKDPKEDSKKDAENAKEDTLQLESSMLVNDARKEVSIIKFTRIPAKKCLTSALFVVISQYDLDSLKRTNWVTEGVVEYYMDILHRNMDMDIRSTYSQLGG